MSTPLNKIPHVVQHNIKFHNTVAPMHDVASGGVAVQVEPRDRCNGRHVKAERGKRGSSRLIRIGCFKLSHAKRLSWQLGRCTQSLSFKKEKRKEE